MHRFASKPYTWLALVIALLAGISSLRAQTNYGSVRGEVKDVQGGLIAGAKITLTNQDTKVTRTDVTNSAGSYLFGGVDPGTYKVAVTVTGFKTYETNGNIVTIGNTSTVDAALAIGDTSETVEVTSNTLTLNTASASGGQLFSETQIQELPSLGRNPFLLAALDANVVTLGDPRYVRAEDSTGSSQVSLAGAPSGTNSYAVDGIPVSTSSGGETYIVSPDATSEAKVQTNTYDAEVGRTGGGVFANSLKIGTSQYHGELYGETRQTPWSANVWYNNKTPKSAAPSDTTYLYSGAFGGPLPFMKKSHWLDNTFFWVTEEGYRQGQPNTGTNTFYVPTAAERSGDYSADAVLLYDPTKRAAGSGTNTCRLSKLGDCGGAGGLGSTADPLNVLPASYVNPIGNYALSVIPQPTNANTYASAASGNYFLANQSFKTRSDEYVGKVEHTFAPWWTTSASYLHDAIQEPGLSFLVTNFCNCTKLIRYFDSTIVNNSFTLNSSTLLTVGYGFNRYYSSAPEYSTGFNSATGFNGSGFPSSFTSQQQSKTFPSFVFSNVTNFSGSLIGGASGGPTVQASNNFVAVLTKTLGRNTFKAGYVFRAFNYRTTPTTGSAGIFTFNGQYTVANGQTSGNNGPAAFADAQLGLPSSASMQINAGPFYNKETYNSVFLQDDIRVNDKLTINAGIRYEYELGQFEKNNKFNVGFDPNATSSYTNQAGNTVNLKGGLEFAGVGGYPQHCCQPSHAKFSPRIGVSYSPMKDTVVHAGFGLFYAPVGITPETSGYSQVTSYSTGNVTAPVAVGTGAYLSNPFSSGGASVLLQPTGNSLGALTGVGGSVAVLDTKRQVPYVEQYSLDIQRQLPKDIIVKIAYVGAHGNNFFNSVNINQLPNSVLAAYAPGGANYGQSLATKVPNTLGATTIGGIPATGTASFSANPTIAQAQLLLPFPQFTSVTVSKSNGYSWYNSLALKGEKRMARGLTVLGTYTWSSNWDNLYGTGSQVFSTYGAQDNYNIGAEYARSINSIPNRLTAAVVYDLPVGKGRKYLGNANGFGGHLRDAAVGGWTINYEVVDQNGVPLSVIQTDLSTNLGITGVGGSYQRPNLVGDPHNACVSGSPQTRLGQANGISGTGARQYVNQAAFTAAPAYTYGNVSRSLPCRAPGSNTTTASINKTFNIYKEVKFQFRAEALNLYNTPQFGYPTTTLGVTQASAPVAATVNPYAASNQSFGNLTSQIGFGRIIQLGGRISF
jgi:hypothetical protein